MGVLTFDDLEQQTQPNNSGVVTFDDLQPEEKGMVGQLSDRFKERGQRVQRLKGKANPFATGLQSMGEGMGFVFGDVPSTVLQPAMKAAVGLGDIVIGGLPVPFKEGTVREELPKSINALSESLIPDQETMLALENKYPTQMALAYGTAGFGEGIGYGKMAEPAIKGAKTVGRELASAAKVTGKGVTYPVRKGVGYVSEKLSPDIDLSGAGKMRKYSGEKYKLIEQAGEVIPAEQFGNKFIEGAEMLKPKTVTKGGRLSKEQVLLQNEIDDVVGMIGYGDEIGLQGIESLYQNIGNKIDKYVDKTTGKIDATGYQLSKLQENLLDLVDEIPSTQLNKEARELWKASIKMHEINKIIERSQMVDNPATAMKTGFRNLYLNDKKMRGYTSKERELIKAAANGSPVLDLLRTTLGTRLNYLAGLAGGGLPGATTGALTSMAARGGANAMMSRKAAGILEEIARPGMEIVNFDKFHNIVSRMANGEKISKKEIFSLPPADAKKLLEIQKRYK